MDGGGFDPSSDCCHSSGITVVEAQPLIYASSTCSHSAAVVGDPAAGAIVTTIAVVGVERHGGGRWAVWRVSADEKRLERVGQESARCVAMRKSSAA